jgi:hypothetical protein
MPEEEFVCENAKLCSSREVLRFRCLLKIAISKHRSARRVLLA